MSNVIYGQIAPKSISFCQYSGCGKPTNNPRFCNLSCAISCANIKKKEKRITEYLSNPKPCFVCGATIPYKLHKQNKFCGSSCAAVYNNKLRSQESREKQQKTINETYSKIPRKIRPPSNTLAKDRLSDIYPYTPIIWKQCGITGKYYHNRTADGSQRKSSPYGKDIKKIYYHLTRFRFDVKDMPEIFDISLLENNGWYMSRDSKKLNRKKNIDGISRDHLFSVSNGLQQKIHPLILSHPVNCKLVKQRQNVSKNSKCDITIEELIREILYFDNSKHQFKNHQLITNLIYSDQIFIEDFESLRKFA